MRIPSGDLAPARRRRRHAFGRRRGRALPVALLVLLLAGAGGTAYARRGGDARPQVRAAGACPSALAPAALVVPGAQAGLPAPGRVRLRLFNGTGRGGLGRTVGAALAARGFGVLSTGNAARPLAGPSRVAFGPGARPAATLLAAHVSGARLVPVPTGPRGAVDLTLGSTFVRLRTPAEVPAALRALQAPAPARRAPAAARPSASARC